ncbi:GNAT family N-acetyltransferase [Solitalea koreensis]|uniref:Protein N-acetyltransferase, RimJ/RimL family n=1 Tax=Solitalea koreensis TaxID=543615 RepID=A0A521CS33_9SPHI|nr:GNAT family N-acetyltransferase [Solitalea koreensis]SMO62242.1 Protein N-acetyltransferase, RimJ/RimL family [Solitalea koreensis]
MYLINTPRLQLREFCINDAENIFILNSDPEVTRFTGDKEFKSLAESKNFIKTYTHYRKYGFGRWNVELKSTSEYLGWCGLKYIPRLKEVDLGYRFMYKHWGKGYATESSIACLNYGFCQLGFEKIVGRAMKVNSASINVLKKVGMCFEKSWVENGNIIEQYSISNDKWQQADPFQHISIHQNQF